MGKILAVRLINVVVGGGIFMAMLPLAQAEHRPLREWGIGITYVVAPIYRGAKPTRDYVIPIPFVRLRGEVLAADEDGMKGRIFKNNRLKLSISLGGSLPVSDDTDGARKGMPNLDLTFGVGPSLKYLLWKPRSNAQVIRLELPLRAVFSVGDPILAYQGWTVSPLIGWIRKFHSPGAFWRLKIGAGPLFADRNYNNYFYQVESKFSTAQRPAYNTHSGYTGSRISFKLSLNTKHIYLGVFARYDDLRNAVFIDSPLVETEDYAIFGIVASWIFSNSTAKAKHW
ncbi:MAG: MipA/OmpV family protein [Thiohalomonadales bacterium]